MSSGNTGSSRDGLPASKRLALEVHMASTPELTRISDVDGWDEASPFAYRPPRTWGEFERELDAQASAFSDPPLPRVVRALAQYAGVAPDATAREYFTLDSKLSPMARHPWARLGLPGRQANVFRGSRSGVELLPHTDERDPRELRPKITIEHHGVLQWIVNRTPPPHDRAGALTRQIQHVADILLRGSEPIVTPEQGVTLMRMVDASYESDRTQLPVSFPRT